MIVNLKVMSGPQTGQVLKVTQEKFLVGRADDCQLRPNSEKISRHHCLLLLDEGKCVLRDLGSKNGTLVNGNRVEGEQPLKRGDVLEIGPLKFEVSFTVELKGEKKPVVKSIAEAASRTAQSAQAGRSKSVDNDVQGWLENDAAGQDEETAILSASDLGTIRMGESGSATKAASAPPPAPEPPKGPAKPKVNSQDAAADALKRFLERR